MIQRSTSLKYEPSLELLLNTAKQLSLNRELYRLVSITAAADLNSEGARVALAVLHVPYSLISGPRGLRVGSFLIV